MIPVRIEERSGKPHGAVDFQPVVARACAGAECEQAFHDGVKAVRLLHPQFAHPVEAGRAARLRSRESQYRHLVHERGEVKPASP